MFNVKTTSTKEPEFVLEQLEEMLAANQYEVKKKGYDVFWLFCVPPPFPRCAGYIFVTDARSAPTPAG